MDKASYLDSMLRDCSEEPRKLKEWVEKSSMPA
jgi:hypothetical protein